MLFVAIFATGVAWPETFMGLEIRPEFDGSYERDDFPHWIDGDGDGQDARAEVLEDEDLAEDLWVCPFTGLVIYDSSLLDIDHVVPLREAHQSGAHAWNVDRRRQYANDLESPNHLRAVWLSANRSKGDRDPAEWMPPNRAFWCQYLEDWVSIKIKYALSVDQTEAEALELGMHVCSRYEKRDSLEGRQ